MQKEKYITFYSKKKEVALDTESILYVTAENNKTNIHTTGGELYETRLTLWELEEALSETFIKIKRGILVSVAAVESVTDLVHLKNGEALHYTIRQKKRIIDELLHKSVTDSAAEGE